jgi:hypothetical protein
MKSLRILTPALLMGAMMHASCGDAKSEAVATKDTSSIQIAAAAQDSQALVRVIPTDTASYREKLKYMSNGDTTGKWPANAAIPMEGAILPFKRVIAYYGNLYSTRMGILGELPKDQMLAKLKEECQKWEKADPQTPVQPALHYIAVTAQGAAGKDGKYRLRMPFKEIDKVLAMAEEAKAIVFIDIQVALSTIQAELPLLVEYLKKPNVHLGIDPEFSMKGGQAPGKVIGSYDASDINFCTEYLAKLVRENNLPPKILVVHRFTGPMVTNYKNIKTHPEVQIVMHMDGWGEPAKKVNTYRQFIYSQPVQFTGFKLFYKNDLKRAPHKFMNPEDLMKLKPHPVYIQYQ